MVNKKSQKECPPFATTTAGYTVAGFGSPCFLDYTVAGFSSPCLVTPVAGFSSSYFVKQTEWDSYSSGLEAMM